MKLSPGKVNDPGAHQVTRRADGTHVLHLADEALDGVRAAARGHARRRAHRRGAGPRGRPRPRRRRARAAPRRRLGPARALAAPARAARAPGSRRPTTDDPDAGEEPAMHAETALIAVDVQHDFLPGGALGVPGGDAVVAPLVRAARDVGARRQDARRPSRRPLLVRRAGRTWPPHCVAGTHGAELHPAIAALPGPVIDKAHGARAPTPTRASTAPAWRSCCATPASRTSSSAGWRRTTA